jgi:CYTH domain-containing protein
MEIERKWRLDSLPKFCTNDLRQEINQGYIFDGEFELRLRRIAGYGIGEAVHYLTTKGSGHLARHEWESEIPQWVFEGLWEKAAHTLMKDRFTIYRVGRNPDGSVPIRKFEFDEYKLGLFGLVIVECEFSTKEEAEAFVLPDWVGHATEVTKDHRYKNQMLARLGSLQILQQNDSV